MAKKTTVVKGGLIGIILGAIGGILFAPKSGRETRSELRDAASKANKEAEAKLKELHNELKSRSEEIKTLADEYGGKAQKEYEDLGKQADVAKQRVSELIASVRDFEVDDIDVDKAIKEGRKLIASIARKIDVEDDEPAKAKKPAAKKPKKTTTAKKPAASKTKKAPAKKSSTKAKKDA